MKVLYAAPYRRAHASERIGVDAFPGCTTRVADFSVLSLNIGIGFTVNRELVAYGLIAIMIVGLAGWFIVALRKRKRAKLRRRGIKRYGH